jgi:hypothetical protein
LAVADGVVIIMSGAVGGACFQTIAYPLTKLQMESRKISVPNSRYRNGLRLLKKNGLFHYFKGVHTQLLRAAPPSAIGLFVYELSSEWIAKLDKLDD